MPLRLFIFAILFFLLLLHCLSYVMYINDDAYISFRYARNLAEGHGIVYNKGERVEGYTNFLWMLIFAALHFAFPHSLDINFWAKFLGLLASMGTLATVILISYQLQHSKPTSATEWIVKNHLYLFAPLLLALNPCFAVNTMSGLETAFFTFLLTAAIYLELRLLIQGKKSYAAIIFGLAALTRPEGLLYFGFALLARIFFIIKRRRALWKATLTDLLIFCAITAPYILFKYIYYDYELLPNTYWAKYGGFGSGLIYIAKYFYLTSFFIGLIFITLALSSGRKEIIYILWLTLAGFIGIVKTGGDWMVGFRMIIPVTPLLSLLVQEGLFHLVEKIKAIPSLTQAKKNWLIAGLVVLLGCSLLPRFLGAIDFYNYVNVRAIGYKTGHLSLTQWLVQQTKSPEDKIALMDVGLVGYYLTPQPILDITGLTDRYIAKSPGFFLRKQYDARYVLQQRPKFIVLVNNEPPRLHSNKVEIGPNFWTPMEFNIYTQPEFQGNYIFATYFRHLHPGLGYYLLVFKRKD